MLFLSQGCLGLSFKKWTGLQDGGLKNRQDYRIAGFTEQGAAAQLGAFWTGLQDLRDCYNSHPVHPVNPVYFFARFLGK